MSRWRLRRTRPCMDFEWCFGTFVPSVWKEEAVPDSGNAKHGIDPTTEWLFFARPLQVCILPELFPTRSVRRASGLVQTRFWETIPGWSGLPRHLPLTPHIVHWPGCASRRQSGPPLLRVDAHGHWSTQVDSKAIARTATPITVIACAHQGRVSSLHEHRMSYAIS